MVVLLTKEVTVQILTDFGLFILCIGCDPNEKDS